MLILGAVLVFYVVTKCFMGLLWLAILLGLGVVAYKNRNGIQTFLKSLTKKRS